MQTPIEMFFGFVAQPLVPWIIALGLIAWACAGWLTFTAQMRSPLDSLERARSRLKLIKGSAEFYEKYEDVNDRISKDEALGAAWTEFSETLIISSAFGGRVRNTTRPETYFNQAILTKSGVNLRYFNALPNFLVGAGLLFTFLGLIAALYFASQGIGTDVTKAIDALQKLLSAATFKFVTSITGLGASIIFSICQKRALNRFSHLLDDFCFQLESRMDFVSPVALADQSLKQLESQTCELQRFNTDLAVSIAQALDERIGETFSRALAPLAATLEEMTKSIGSASEDALRSMIEDFSRTIQGAAGTEIKALAANLQDVGATLSGLIDGIKQANTAIQDDIVKSGERLTEQIGGAGDIIAERLGTAGDLFTSRVGDTINSFVNALDRFPARIQPIEQALGQLSGTMQSANDALSRTLTGTETLLDQIATITHDLSTVADPIKEAAQNLLTGIADLRVVNERAQRSQTVLADVAQMLKAVGDNLLERAGAQEQRFNDLDTSLAAVFRELQVGLESYREAVEKFVADIDSNMADVVQKLAASVDELKEVLEDTLPRSVAA